MVTNSRAPAAVWTGTASSVSSNQMSSQTLTPTAAPATSYVGQVSPGTK